MNSDSSKTHFGYQSVDTAEKESKVAQVFTSVASKYDIMNDLMSLGIHRLWKKFAIDKANVRPGNIVLDLAAGTADLSRAFAKKVGDKGHVVVTDINGAMLNEGRDRLIDAGIISNVSFLQVNAERLPFADNYFDCISIAFGLRNVTHKDNALEAMYRALKPGGTAIILEFSKPTLEGFNKLYDCYSFNILPKLGKMIAGDADSYQYLAESIRMHPNQEALKAMALAAGFDACEYFNLSGGITALHCCYKY